jgi:rhamnogalacturonan hydrolase
MKFSTIVALAGALFVSSVKAQLSGTVGPTTTTAHKAATKVCNILSYGGVASKTTDNGPAIASAWADCKAGGESKSFLLKCPHIRMLLIGLNSLHPCR